MNDEKKSYDVLKQDLKQAAAKIQVGALYVHYKHPELPYQVKGFAIWEVTDEVAVLYHPLHQSEVVFVRPLAAWLETVEWEGKMLPRFTRVVDPTVPE